MATEMACFPSCTFRSSAIRSLSLSHLFGGLVIGGVLSVAGMAGDVTSDTPPEVRAGTTFADLGVDSPIILNASNTEFSLAGDIAESASLDAGESWMALRLDVRITYEDDDATGQEYTSTLSASVNGRAAVQLLVTHGTSGGIDANAIGWVEGKKVFSERPGSPLEFSYANYLMAGSTTPDEDTIVVRLDPDPGTPGISIQVLPTSGFESDVVPGSSTVLDVTDVRIEEDQVTTLVVDYRFTTDRATSATLTVQDAIGLVGVDELEPVDLEIVDGVASGSMRLRVDVATTEVRGLLVAGTDFNSPAASFALDHQPNSVERSDRLPRLISWGASFAGLVLIAYAFRNRRRSSESWLQTGDR